MRKNLTFIFIIAAGILTSCGEKEDVVTISTTYGDIVILLYDQTPFHKANFIKLTKEGFYDSLTFHRVMDGFMIQGGDPNSRDDDPYNDGLGGPGYTVGAEFDPELTHAKGALAAARQPDNVNPTKASSGSQFYIVENESGTPHLDGGYTVFGQTIDGFDVVDEIASQPVDRRNRPYQDIKMSVSVKPMTRRQITKTFGYEYPEN